MSDFSTLEFQTSSSASTAILKTLGGHFILRSVNQATDHRTKQKHTEQQLRPIIP